MQRMKRFGLMFLAAIVLFTGIALAQEAAPAAAKVIVEWGPIAAAGIGVLVMLFVQLVAYFVPGLDGGVKQVLALVASPLLMWLAGLVSDAIGYPVDFKSLIDAIVAATGSGLTAMGAFDVLKKFGLVGASK
jgi:hypothetical protein